MYVDTSVFGGVHDIEFSWASQRFFELVSENRVKLVISPLVLDEVEAAPERVRVVLAKYFNHAEILGLSGKALELRDAFIHGGIVSSNSIVDAYHVACAVVAGCHVIVSWNFKDIVNFQKIPKYNAISQLMGYSEISIHSPAEVDFDENQDKAV